MTDYELHERPELRAPVLVVMLSGWIDAGGAAGLAAAALDAELGARPVATFDADRFLDYRARRPVMELRDGVNTRLVWPDTVLKAGRDRTGNDVLLLVGHEPDSAWRAFCGAVVDLAVGFGTRLVVGLGAYPFATPHSRPSRLSITANSEALASSLPYLRNSVDVPAGVEAALEEAFAGRDVPAVGLWAQVPHYVAGSAYPGAALALLGGLHDVAGIASDPVELRQEAAAHRTRIDTLIEANEEHQAMLRQMEAAYDAEAGELAPPVTPPLPSGDELAAELERYLRDQG